MNDFMNYVPKVHFEQIQIKNLVSNQEYQRNLSIKHVRKAAENFDLCQINPVKVSRRDGINYVFNGQHTIEIIALVSGSRETPVWCMIYDDLEYEHEADIFANQMKYVKRLLPYEMFRANIEAGSDKHILINELVESYGLEITPSCSPGGICAVSTLEYIYDNFGLQMLSHVLMLCIGTWEGTQHSFSANMLKAICRLIYVYGDDLRDDLFKERLGKVSLREVIRMAKDRRSGPLGYAEALLFYYNKKVKNPLRMEYLYSKTPPKQNRISDNPENFELEEPATYEKKQIDINNYEDKNLSLACIS